MRRHLALPLSAICFISICTIQFALAEISRQGNLQVNFAGGISPSHLPRHRQVPIIVRIGGTIGTTGKAPLPELRTMIVRLNRVGRLTSQGLPVCVRRRLVSTTPSEALGKCGRALVGGGAYTVRTVLAGQPEVDYPGQILLFNATHHGAPAIIGHLYEQRPLKSTHIMVFTIRHTAKELGTIISGALPAGVSRSGRVRELFFQLGRRFSVGGRPRAYLSASCPTPAGVQTASFRLARASMYFADGRRLSSTLNRTCVVRGG